MWWMNKPRGWKLYLIQREKNEAMGWVKYRLLRWSEELQRYELLAWAQWSPDREEWLVSRKPAGTMFDFNRGARAAERFVQMFLKKRPLALLLIP